MDIKYEKIEGGRFVLTGKCSVRVKRRYNIPKSKEPFIERFIMIYNFAIYGFIVLATIVVLGFVLFRHGILLKDCFYY